MTADWWIPAARNRRGRRGVISLGRRRARQRPRLLARRSPHVPATPRAAAVLCLRCRACSRWSATGTPFEFYAINDAFQPDGDCEAAAGELLLVVNYFGVLSPFVEARADADVRAASSSTTRRRSSGAAGPMRGRSILPASFSACPTAASSTDPPRARTALPPSRRRRLRTPADAAGRRRWRAWEQFREHEARIGIEPRAMSVVSTAPARRSRSDSCAPAPPDQLRDRAPVCSAR